MPTAQVLEIERLNRLYSALSHISQAIVRTHTRDELLRRVCEVLVQDGAFRMAWIGWHEPATHRLLPVAQAGDENDYLKSVEVYADHRPEGHGPSGRAFRENRPYICEDVLQAVKITPRDSRAAALTFVLTGYPGVMVHAGVLHDFPFPVCGCDACDETVETVADRLEMLVLSVAAGGYSERYPVGRNRWSEYVLAAFDGSGSESGRGEPAQTSGARLHDAEIRLREVVGGWSPWPLRGS